jgi:hypothetical protein
MFHQNRTWSGSYCLSHYWNKTLELHMSLKHNNPTVTELVKLQVWNQSSMFSVANTTDLYLVPCWRAKICNHAYDKFENVMPSYNCLHINVFLFCIYLYSCAYDKLHEGLSTYSITQKGKWNRFLLVYYNVYGSHIYIYWSR